MQRPSLGRPGGGVQDLVEVGGGAPLVLGQRMHVHAEGEGAAVGVAELGGAGEVTSVTAPPGGPITVTWGIKQAGSQGLTENNARFGVMRIMRAVQKTQLAAGGAAPTVRLVGQYQLAGAAAPVTVVRLRFDPTTVERGDFDDRRYLEAFDMADAAVIHPAFRG